MASAIAGFVGPLSIEQFKGGQSNPTYLLASPGGRYVLRRKPRGVLLASAHAIDREFRVMRALAGRVSVPLALAYCDDAGVIGTEFFVMDCVEGEVLWNPSLPRLSPDERCRVFDAMTEAIAAIHAVDPAAAGLGDFGRPENYVSRQVARWTRQYRASETGTIDAMERLIEWLPSNLPQSEASGIVHGDFRLDNLIFKRGSYRVAAVLDWELATLGDTLADFTYNAMTFRLPPDPLRGLDGIAGIVPGVPSEADYVAAYCRRTGRDAIPHYGRYMAFNLFRLAAILQGVRRRHEEGKTSSEQAHRVGSSARLVAELGWAAALAS